MKTRYFGWRIVIVGFFMMACIFAPMINLSGIFIIPLSEGFSVSRSAATLVTTIATVLTMAVSLFAGKLLSRFNIKKMVALFLVLSAVGCLLCAVGPNLVVVTLGAAVRGISFPFACTLPLSILVGNWFGPKIRGRAWALTTMGTGIGLMVLSPVTGAIMEHWGWRWGYAFYALLALVMIPFVLLTFVRHPKDKGLTQLGAADDQAAAGGQSGIPLAGAMRSGVLWLFLLAVLLLAGSVHNWNMNGAAYFSDIGFSAVSVSLLLSVASIGITASKFVIGLICDKFGTRAGVMVPTFAMMAGCVIFIFAYQMPMLAYPGAVLMGFGVSVITVTPALMARDLFGDKDYGTIAGFMQSGQSLGSAIFPLVASAGFDLMGNYIPGWAGAFALCLVAVFFVTAAYKMQPKLVARHWAT